MLRFLIPGLFVLIWSSGFIVGKAAVPHADLQRYLLARFALTALVMAIAALPARAAWPRGRQIGLHLVAGVLMQGVYLCASYWAIQRGLPAGVMALLGALQPVFTALFLATRGESLPVRTWIGLCVGFAGVALVLEPRLAGQGTGSLTFLTVAAALFSVIGITAGALFQKKLAGTDLRTAACIQNIGGALVAILMVQLVGTDHWDNAPALWGALAWAVLVASVIGTTLLMWMMRHGEATHVTALMLLAPPLAAVLAYLFFNETLLPLQLVGFALALGGVLLARSSS
ncbi:MAG TPA: DMT family transporter [Steroidobacteraceae bacterium]|nr:DMT family transporter [Steroidobacteraceae bacterium]